MRTILKGILCLCLLLCLAACGGTGKGETASQADTGEGAAPEEAAESMEIRDFYYTYENINYNARYQRYRFYTEEGRHMFFHEKREVHDDYGPATEKDITLTGTRELTEEEWQEFLSFAGAGRLSPRDEDPVDGDSGPWMFLYQEGGDPEGLVFTFSSYQERLDFEAFCAGLAGQ